MDWRQATTRLYASHRVFVVLSRRESGGREYGRLLAIRILMRGYHRLSEPQTQGADVVEEGGRVRLYFGINHSTTIHDDVDVTNQPR